MPKGIEEGVSFRKEMGLTPSFVKIYSTPNQGEIAVIKSILDAQGITYYIKGENFGVLYGAANGLSSMDVMVADDRRDEAKELLKEFIKQC